MPDIDDDGLLIVPLKSSEIEHLRSAASRLKALGLAVGMNAEDPLWEDLNFLYQLRERVQSAGYLRLNTRLGYSAGNVIQAVEPETESTKGE